MAFNINEFSSQVNGKGVAVNNLFFVTITLPNVLAGLNNTLSGREISFLCRTVDLPPFTVGTSEVRPQGHGLAEKRPTSFQFENLSTVFMVDAEFAVKKFFHRWIQAVVNYDTRSGILSEVNGRVPFEFGYKRDFAATITVHVYSDNTQSFEYVYEFSKAWPTFVGGNQVAWENSAEVMTLPVTFTYSGLKVDGAEGGSVTSDNSRANGLLTYLSAINSYGQAINQLRRPRDIQDLINQVTDVRTILRSL